MRRTLRPVLVATLALGANATANIVVPAGFAVDVIPHDPAPNTRLEAVRNPAFGTGVVAAWIENGTLTVRRVSGDGTIDCDLDGFLGTDKVWDIRFDTTGLFDDRLFVSVGNSGTGTRALVYVVDAACDFDLVASRGGDDNELVFSLDFATGAHGYQAGVYLEDIDGEGPPFPSTALWHGTWSQDALDTVELSPNLLPPDRTDLDAWIEFDRTAAETYDGHMLVCDCDGGNDELSAIYRLKPDLTFELLTDIVATSERCLTDLAISSGGLFGEVVYVADSATDEVKTGAGLATFASGFTGISSLTVSESGNALYVLDSDAIYRIRRACSADLDGSGAVDFNDLLRILAAWGPCPGCPEDLDDSGTVDFNDLLLVLTAWGPCV